jgi:hypothetical protein
MSQSDHIKRLRLATELKEQTPADFPPVLGSRDYTVFKEYAVINSVKNTAPLYGDLSLGPTDVALDTSYCPVFIAGFNTNQRPNRVLMSSVYFTPTPQPRYVKNTPKSLYVKNNRKECC